MSLQSTDHGKQKEVLVPKPEARRRTGLASSTFDAKVAAGEFRPVKVGVRSVRFLESEIDDWIAARVAERERNAGAV